MHVPRATAVHDKTYAWRFRGYRCLSCLPEMAFRLGGVQSMCVRGKGHGLRGARKRGDHW
eukprot:6190495-Pleurochrysis_carterae.AAC.2